jgi:transposase
VLLVKLLALFRRQLPLFRLSVVVINLAQSLQHIFTFFGKVRGDIYKVAQNFPEECRYVLESLGSVYVNDAAARERKLSAQARLRFHQQQSGPVMEELHGWLEAQLAEKKTDPNSGLGKAITYLLRHWNGLTAFLREAGAPLDNNICERALKRAVLHRKNALFYKTLHGAEVGDVFMSLIHTCQLCGATRLSI